MIISLLFGRRSLVGHVFYGIRSALLVTTVLVTAPHLAEAEREAPLRDQETRVERGLLAGAISHVRDGDTIELAGVAVRVANLDCPETGTSAGLRATRRMRSLAGSGPVTCRLSGRRSYDREVGLCRLYDGRDVGQVLIAEGFCQPWQ